MNLKSLIKERALELGFCKSGLTSADDFDQYLEILDSRGDDYAFHRVNPQNPIGAAKPRSIWPEARSILVLAFDYGAVAFPPNLLPLVARIYQGRCYTPPPDSIGGLRLQAMITFIRQLGLKVEAGMMIPARWAGARAGVSNFGRNNFAYVDDLGSFVVLYTLVLNRELEYDSPTLENKCPEKCRACVKACPTNSLCEPFKMKPGLCLAFNAWKTQDGVPGVNSAFIPRDIRPKMDRHVHGCDICQEVCPRNKEKIKGFFPADRFLDMIAPDITLANLLKMPEGFFEQRVRPIMYNYIKEPKYFQRNAAVALGNAGDRAAVNDLVKALGSAETILRAHAAWALGRLGGAKAKAALKKSLARELSAEVRAEISLALD